MPAPYIHPNVYTDEKTPGPPVGLPATHPGSPLLFPAVRPLPRRTGLQRFLRAFLWIGFAFLVIPALVRESRRFAAAFADHRRGHIVMEHAESPDSCVRSAHWSFDAQSQGPHYTHSARTSFDLPVDSDLLYLVARGSATLAHGTVQITDSGEPGSDVAKVDIAAYYDNDDLLDLVKVCLLQPAEGQNGVGIFAPPHFERRHHRDRLEFHVQVHLPPASGDAPLAIKRFETDMPIFVHYVGDIQNSVLFDAISLHTSNVPVKVESLTATRAEIKTSNSPIEGTFNSSKTIDLTTSNAFIKAEVGLTNEDEDAPTELVLKTSNGPISSNISLTAASEAGTGGAFSVNARTSNSPLSVTYVDAPVDSALTFVGHTSNSPASAVLHRTFEGTFALHASPWFGSAVHVDENAEDPAGRGRRRVVEMQRVSRGATEGHAHWAPGEGNGRGSVEMSTSNMGVSLSL